MRDTIKYRSGEVLPGIRIYQGKWTDIFLEWVPDVPVMGGSWMEGATGSDIGYDKFRPLEDRDRLMVLRRQQDNWEGTHAVWMESLEWPDKRLGIEISKHDAFEAHKVALMSNQTMARFDFKEPTDYENHRWTGTRVKACLRSGKMLSYDILKRVKAGLNWVYVEKMIAEAGELPDLNQDVLDAIMTVRNEGYSDALAEIQAGNIADQSEANRRKRQDRALDLVASILRGWSGADEAASKGARSSTDRDTWDQGTEV